MAKPKKSSGKPAAKPTTSNTSLTAPIPSPFKPAPAELSTFLGTLTSKSHLYIVHLDTHPLGFKRRIFAVPLLLNIFILILLVFRLQKALPTYFFLLLSVLGYDSPANIDKENTDQLALLGISGERTLMFAGDFLLFRFVGMWPWDFFLGKGREGKLFKERVLPAVDKEWVRNKTSYQMLDQNWDLYFSGMIEAQALVDEAKNKTDDFQTSVLVHTDKWGWLIWEVWREHEEGAEDEGTKKLQLIKNRLTAMGKENLFFRWIEVVQSETSQPGPFTVERQKKAVQKIRGEFQDQGVEFEEFWESVGGVEGMPGMEAAGTSRAFEGRLRKQIIRLEIEIHQFKLNQDPSREGVKHILLQPELREKPESEFISRGYSLSEDHWTTQILCKSEAKKQRKETTAQASQLEKTEPSCSATKRVIYTFFTPSSLSESAQQADGTWGRDYKTSCFLISDKRFSAICLGKLILTILLDSNMKSQPALPQLPADLHRQFKIRMKMI
ncbi:MAG: hypothetical protein ASARMPRED_004927 [Alectoria sarmentosa]|nr:MAG: hypothetical protein ASARMPRED_004927 [Alectoria sarmentosa]